MAVKKGFTLVELLGVIILLGVVGLIVVPSITKLIKDSRQKLYENQVKMIEESARKWGVQNTQLLKPNTITYIDLQDLINNGYIEQDTIKDPRTSEDMNGCIVISYSASSNKYKYSYNDRDCLELDDSNNMTSTHPQYMCYTFDSSTGTIVKYDVDNTNCLSDVVIPNKIDDVVVRHIGNAAFINENGQECYSDPIDDENDGVLVSHNYVRNDSDGYYGCYFGPTEWEVHITSVTFPKYLETIGTSAFAENSITSLDFSNLPNLVRINDDAFYGNPVENIIFTNASNLVSIGAWALSDMSLTSLDLRPLTSLETISAFAFAWSSINSVNLQGLDSLTTIGASAFEDNYLTSITIPSSVETIGTGAFEDNYLTSITIPSNVKTIGSWAFWDNSIESVAVQGDHPYRFNNSWYSIGFPYSLMSSNHGNVVEVERTLSTSSPNDFGFEYEYYKIIVPTTGTYRLEVWGAQGGISSHHSYEFNRGGYSVGNVTLNAGTIIYVYVGSKGYDGFDEITTPFGGFNSGGNGGSGHSDNAGGGGATDIRLGGNTLANRIIVAGGGGGNGCNSMGGYGGGLIGGDGTEDESYGPSGTGGTQAAGGVGQVSGSFGLGGNGLNENEWGSGGGGGGYYGGSAGTSYSEGGSAGGGGSGYIGGVTSGQTIAGNATMPNPNGGMMTGRIGNGYVRITYLGA